MSHRYSSFSVMSLIGGRHSHPGNHLVKTMSRHYNCMTQDRLLIGVSIGGEGRVTPLTLIHTPTLIRVTGQWAELQPRMGCKTRALHFF